MGLYSTLESFDIDTCHKRYGYAVNTGPFVITSLVVRERGGFCKGTVALPVGDVCSRTDYTLSITSQKKLRCLPTLPLRREVVFPDYCCSF